ncbi:glutamic acid-rich protein, partial [Cystoisospora suis]
MASVFSSFLKKKVRDHLSLIDSALEIDTLLTRARATALHFFENRSLPPSIPLDLSLSLSSLSSSPSLACSSSSSGSASSCCNGDFASSSFEKKSTSRSVKNQADGYTDRDDLGRDEEKEKEKEDEEEEERRDKKDGKREGERVKSEDEKSKERRKQKEEQEEIEKKKRDVKEKFDVEVYRQSTRLVSPLPVDQLEKFHQILHQILLLCRQQKAADALKRKEYALQQQKEDPKSKKTNLALSSSSFSSSLHASSRNGGVDTPYESRDHAKEAELERRRKQREREEQEKEEERKRQREKGGVCQALANHPYGLGVICASLHLQKSFLQDGDPHHHPATSSSFSLVDEKKKERIGGIVQDALEVLEILLTIMIPTLYKDIEERRNASLILKPDSCGVCTPEDGDEQGYGENEEDDEEEEESLLEEDEEGDSFFNVEDLLPLNRRSFFIAREKEVDPHRSRCWDKGESERRRRNVIEGIEEELERRRTKDLISEEDETMLLSGVYVHLLESVMSYTINGDLIVSLLLLPEVYIQHAALLILQKLYTSSDILHDIANSRISFYRKQRNLRHLLLHESTWISKSLLLNFSTAPSSTSLSPSSFHTPPSSSISRRDQDLFVREKEEKLKIERAIGVKKKGRLMCQCIETSFLNRPMCINRLTTSLQEDNDEEIKADFVRYEALEVLRILSTRNPDLQTIITFQGAIEALLSLLSSELSLNFYAPSQASSSSSSSHLHRYHVKAASQSSGVSPPSVSTLQMLLKSSRVRSILRCMYSLTKSSPVRKYVREANLLQPFLLLLEILLKAKDQQLKEIGRFSRKMERRFLIEEKCESPPSSFSRGVKFHRVFFDMLQGDLPVDGREEEKKRKREREGGKEKEEDRHVPGRNRGREGEDEKFSSHLFSSGVTSGVHTPHGVDASQDQEILSDLSSSLTSSTPLDISLSLVFAIFRHFFPVSSSLPRRSSSPSSRKIRTPVSACFSRLSPALSPSEKRRRRGRGRGAQEGEEEMKKKEKREGLANEVRSNQLVFLQHGALDLFSQQIAKISNTLAFFFYQNTSTNASLLSSSSSLSSSPCLSQKNGLFSSSSDPMAQEEIDGNLSMKTTTPLSPSLGGPQHHNEPLEGFPSSPPLSSFSPFSLGFFSYLLPGVLRLLTQLSQLFLAVIVSTTSLSSSSSSPPHSSEKKSDQEEAAFVDLVLSALLLPSSSPPGGGGGGEQDGSRGEQAMAPSSPPAAGSGGGGAVPPPLYCLVYTALQDGLSGSLHSLLLITLDTIITSFPQVQAHILLGTLETLHSAGLSSSSSSSSSSVSPSSLSASHPANSSSSSPVFLGSFDLFSSLPPLLLLRHASSSSFSSPSPYLDGSHAGNISSVRTPHPTASIHIQAHSHSRRSSREVDEEEDLFELEPPALQILPPGVFIASLLQWLVTRSVHTAEKVSLYRAKQAGLLDMIYSSALQLNHLSSSSSASPLLLGTDESISHDRDEREEGDTKEGIKTPRDHVDEKIHERDVQISLIERQQNLKNDQFERRIRISQAIRALQLLYLCLIDNEDLRVLFSCSYLLPSLCPFFSLRNQDPHLPLSSSSSPLQTSLSTQVQSVGNDTIKKTSINTRYVSSNEGQKRERKEEESLSKHLSSPSSFSPLHEEHQSLLYQLLLYLLPSLCRCIFFYSEKQFLRQRPSKEKRKRYEKKNDKDRDVGEGEEGMIDEEVKEEEEDFYLYSALLSHLLNLLLSFYPTTPSKTERRPRGISFSQQKTRNSRRNEALFEERKISKNRPPPQIMKVAREKQEPPSSRILMSLYSSSSLWNQEGGTEKKRSSSSPIHFLPLGLSWLLTSGLILPSLLLLSLLFSHDEGRPKSPVSSSCTDSEGDVYEVNERRDTALGVAISTRRKQEKKRKKRRKKKKMDVFRCLHVGDSLFILQGSISLLFDRILSVFHTWERRLEEDEEDEEERLSLYEEDRRSPFFRSFFFSQTPAINAGVSLYRSSGGRHLNREDLGSPSFFRRIDRERKEQEKEIDDLEESRTLQRNGGVSDSMRENKKKKKERSHELAARISERERPSERQDQEGEEEERVKNGDAISSSSFLDDIRKRREDTEDLILDIIGADKTALQTINLLNSQVTPPIRLILLLLAIFYPSLLLPLSDNTDTRKEIRKKEIK